MVFSCGLAANAFALFWSRFGVGITKSNSHPGPGVAGRRHVPDRHPRPGQRVDHRRGPPRRRAQPGARRRHRRARRRRRRMAVGVLPARHPGDPAGDPRVPDPGAPTWPVRDARRARRGHRRTRSRRPISIEAAFARLNKIRTYKTMLLAFAAHGVRPVHRAGPAEPLPRGPLRSRGVRARRDRHASTASACCACCRSPRKRYDALFRRDPAKALRLLGVLIVPVGDPPADPVRHAQRGAVHRGRRRCPRILLDRRLHDGQPGAAVGRPLPAARHGIGARRDLRVLHRRHRRGAARGVLHQRPRARAPRRCSSACRARSSAACS